jgi:hypothetical protein
MSLGLCLWQTGAAEWLAINWLNLFEGTHWFVFVMGIAVFVLVMTNLIMNVAAIAITMPVSLVMAPYVGVAPEVILFASLVTAGMPFLFLVGAAPNAIAYSSNQFTTGEFFLAGIPASLLLVAVLALFARVVRVADLAGHGNASTVVADAGRFRSVSKGLFRVCSRASALRLAFVRRPSSRGQRLCRSARAAC